LASWFSFGTPKKSEEDLTLIRFFIRQFGYRPIRLDYFKQALTHRSLSNTKGEFSNERLEFLGDAILDSVVAEYLYTKFPEEDEGYLTKLKSKIVSRQTLASAAESAGVGDHIRYQKGRAIKLSTLEGNALEAIIGAIYLDGGFDSVKRTVYHYIFRVHLDLNSLLEQEIDFKSRLFIWAQKNKLEITFVTLNESIDNGVWNYEVEVQINSKPYGKGKGESKKVAEQAASQETLMLMGEL
jgi:ribonuclease III